MRQLKVEMRGTIEDKADCYGILYICILSHIAILFALVMGCYVMYMTFTVVTVKRQTFCVVTPYNLKGLIAFIFKVEEQFSTCFCRFFDWPVIQGNVLSYIK
jgi:hypothetical protein